MQRIAPNNNLPATHFIEVWHTPTAKRFQESTGKDCKKIDELCSEIAKTSQSPYLTTIAIFKIRKNQIPPSYAQTQPHSDCHHGRNEKENLHDETPRPPSDEDEEMQSYLVWM